MSLDLSGSTRPPSRPSRPSRGNASSLDSVRSLKSWNPWTNESRPVSQTSPRSAASSPLVDDAIGHTGKSAGSFYDALVLQQIADAQQHSRADRTTAGTAGSLDTELGNEQRHSRSSNGGSRSSNKCNYSSPNSNETRWDQQFGLNIATCNSSSNEEPAAPVEATTANEPKKTDSTTEDKDKDDGDTVEEESEDDDTTADEYGDFGDESDSGEAQHVKLKKTTNIYYRDKGGITIGRVNVFSDITQREFAILLSDHVVEAFLVDPAQFRAIASRTDCEIVVSRRILNRRIGSYRWVKYLIVTVRGPTVAAIEQCDRLMVAQFPPYRVRKTYSEVAHVSLFVKDTYPDNSDLYFSFQRTGPTRNRIGELDLTTPYDKMSKTKRNVKRAPWSSPRLKRGLLEPRNYTTRRVMHHVYPEWGYEPTPFVNHDLKFERAVEWSQRMENQMYNDRIQAANQRHLESERLEAI